MAKGLFVVSRCKSDSICLLHPVKRCKRRDCCPLFIKRCRVDFLPAAATFSLFIAEEELCGGSKTELQGGGG